MHDIFLLKLEFGYPTHEHMSQKSEI